MQLHQNPIQRIAPLMVAVLGLSLLSTAAAEHGGTHFVARGSAPADISDLQAEAAQDGNFLTWDHSVEPEDRNMFPDAENPAEYIVYRKVGGEDFAQIATLNARTTQEFLDSDVEEGVTYTYAVEYNDGVQSCDVHDRTGSPSVQCETVEVTAIPFFAAPLVGALAALGGVGAYAWHGRRRT